ncbi:uncharacterized protein PV07_08676 [Cladophialophora immunda]|uniref:Uncharacterized protein n=1 Tax=Cladophialophora immunda TaxID=569365 RepID=A0A0D2C510_9EURO|nr:uncharacterized protein PV07_08676 [Cladophialophora immunda]KIW25510.1 hypothetical protein PV07_08676 [Cladophialophora immunda]
MSDALKKLPVAVDYVFFCAYVAHTHPAETPTINVAMLQNFLDALGSSGVAKTLKRIILVNPVPKQYGVHLGQPKNLMHKRDPRLEGEPWPRNFYYE